jgi:hypothetical protein
MEAFTADSLVFARQMELRIKRERELDEQVQNSDSGLA